MKTTKGLWSRLVAVLAASMLLLVGGLTAQAAAPGWDNGAGIETGLNVHTGVIEGPSGSYYCAVDGDAFALSADPVTSGSMTAAAPVSSLGVSSMVPTGMTPRRATITDANVLAQLAYIASRANTADSQRAAAEHIALQRIAGMYDGSIYDFAERGQLISNNADALIAPARASVAIADDARRNAGPYSVGLSMTINGATGTVQGIGVKSAAGVLQSGYGFTLTLEGPAVWAENGSATLTGTTSGELRSANIRITGNGQVFAKLTIHNMPTTQPWVSTGTSNLGRAQNILLLKKVQPVSGITETHPVTVSFSPVVTSQVVSKELTVGDPLIDELTASAAPGQTWSNVNNQPVPVVVQVDVFGPSSKAYAETMDNANQGTHMGTELVTFNGSSGFRVHSVARHT